MPALGFLVEPLGDGQRLFDGLCALLKGDGIGGDDRDEILIVRMKRVNIGCSRNGQRAIHQRAQISAQRRGRLAHGFGDGIALALAAGLIGKFDPIAAVVAVKYGGISLEHGTTLLSQGCTGAYFSPVRFRMAARSPGFMS